MTYYEQLLTDFLKDIIKPQNLLNRPDLLAGYARLLDVHEASVRTEEWSKAIEAFDPDHPEAFPKDARARLQEIRHEANVVHTAAEDSRPA